MKLIIAILWNEDANEVVDALLEAEFKTTRLASTGGFFRSGNTTIMVGVEDDQVDTVLDIIRGKAHSRPQRRPGDGGETVQTAAATAFVLDLEGYERL